MFDLNLSLILAHSVVFYVKEHYSPNGIVDDCVNEGDPQPYTVGETSSEVLQSMIRYLPDMMKVYNSQILPNEQAQLAAAQATSPAMAALQAQIYGTSGRELNRIGNLIADENAQSQATRDLNVTRGVGRELVQENIANNKLADPEWYNTRALAANGLADMFKPISDGEIEAIRRGQLSEGVNRGNDKVNTGTQTITNAMQYGGAARDRLSQALSQATQALPTFKSGVDTNLLATGRPSMANTGDARFVGANQQTGNQAMGASTGIGNNMFQAAGQFNQLQSQRRDSLDRVNESIPQVSC